jgi:hypothetical protein
MKKALQIMMASFALAACAHVPTIPPVANDWALTLIEARRDVEAGDYDAADRTLTEFARTHPGTSQARESGFWKGMYLIDPANSRGSLPDGIAALDMYLAADSAGLYHDQAAALRRIAVVAQAASHSAKADSASASAVKDTVVVINKSKDEQIAALKDQLTKSKEELAKVNAELDRIKKRLANPSN